MAGENAPSAVERLPASRRAELLVFILLAVLVWPILAIGIVGGTGFVVWMYQLIAGPPGPPH